MKISPIKSMLVHNLFIIPTWLSAVPTGRCLPTQEPCLPSCSWTRPDSRTHLPVVGRLGRALRTCATTTCRRGFSCSSMRRSSLLNKISTHRWEQKVCSELCSDIGMWNSYLVYSALFEFNCSYLCLEWQLNPETNKVCNFWNVSVQSFIQFMKCRPNGSTEMFEKNSCKKLQLSQYNPEDNWISY